MSSPETLEDPRGDVVDGVSSGAPEPGLVLIFSVDRPAFGVIPLAGGQVEIGRGERSGVSIDDPRMSRAHARIAFDGQRWSAQDLKSRNGTFLDGEKLTGQRSTSAPTLLRASASLFLLVDDARPFRAGVVRAADALLGPASQRAFAAVTRAARFGRVLHITGESGSGKELAARAFHAAGPASAGPFVAVNGATLSASLAEAALFGARRGAYTGATSDRPGYVQSAHGGTLFLDEVAELDLAVQAKLLRVLEAREVVPLGAVKPEPIDLRLCSATSADLRARVASGRMRDDLYYRIATPTVRLPPLRERREEIPWLIERAVREVDPRGTLLTTQVSFVEACLLRRWPGNVRELLAEVRAAAQWAVEDGGLLLARHLDPRAGTEVTPAEPPPALEEPGGPARSISAEKPSDRAIEEALRAHAHNVARTARALGMHRTQLYRWIAQRGRENPPS